MNRPGIAVTDDKAGLVGDSGWNQAGSGQGERAVLECLQAIAETGEQSGEFGGSGTVGGGIGAGLPGGGRHFGGGAGLRAQASGGFPVAKASSPQMRCRAASSAAARR